jgi:hypothetical protein
LNTYDAVVVGDGDFQFCKELIEDILQVISKFSHIFATLLSTVTHHIIYEGWWIESAKR